MTSKYIQALNETILFSNPTFTTFDPATNSTFAIPCLPIVNIYNLKICCVIPDGQDEHYDPFYQQLAKYYTPIDKIFLTLPSHIPSSDTKFAFNSYPSDHETIIKDVLGQFQYIIFLGTSSYLFSIHTHPLIQHIIDNTIQMHSHHFSPMGYTEQTKVIFVSSPASPTTTNNSNRTLQFEHGSAYVQSSPMSTSIGQDVDLVFTIPQLAHIHHPTHSAHSLLHLAQSIFGGISITNISLHDTSLLLLPTPQIRLEFHPTNLPHEKYDLNSLQSTIKAILVEAYDTRASPSGVIVVQKDNQVILELTHGFHTFSDTLPSYHSQQMPTLLTDIYDIASLTKIVATTPSVMALTQENKIDLDAPLGSFSLPLSTLSSEMFKTIESLHTHDVIRVDFNEPPRFDQLLPPGALPILSPSPTHNKAHIPLRDILLHQAGLIPYIKFYEGCAWGNELVEDATETHSIKVAEKCFIRNHYYCSIMWPTMLYSPLQFPGKYVYSDLSMYIMKEIVELIEKKGLEHFVQHSFYQSLVMKSTSFQPLTTTYAHHNARSINFMNLQDPIFTTTPTAPSESVGFSLNRIIPTEKGDFRKSLIRGFTHDEGCAMTGGVAGHAGLFSTVSDLSIYSQLLLNNGTYGGKQYFTSEIVQQFTIAGSKTSRRGLGFDRWDSNRSTEYPSKLANSTVYGHTGFTGTSLWIDPYHNLSFIYLANRVHPDRSEKFLLGKFRQRIFDAIYGCIGVTEEPIINPS